MKHFNHLLITTIPKYHRLIGINKFKVEQGKYSLLFHTDKMSLPSFGILYHHGSATMLQMWPNTPSEEILKSSQMKHMLGDYPKLMPIFPDISGATTYAELLLIIGGGLPKEFYAYGREYYGDKWRAIMHKNLPNELFEMQSIKQNLVRNLIPSINSTELELF